MPGIIVFASSYSCNGFVIYVAYLCSRNKKKRLYETIFYGYYAYSRSSR